MELVGLSVGIVLIVIVSFAAIAVFTVVVGRWMRGRFREVSGWAELARRYPGPAASPGLVQKTSIQVGSVYYRFGAEICGTPQGVYLVFRGLYPEPPLLIPWAELWGGQKAMLFWQPAYKLAIGNPVITFLTVTENTWFWLEQGRNAHL